ncbi:MAG TPA: TetR/AcrR family transcriptional regulator [Allosphingosinicella sp.]|nr:TetR/AcrR family transcriptional regulator [Allosphingosinicella sp.]
MNALQKVKGKRAAHREEIRRRIEDALLECMASGQMNRLNHDALAEMTGISRRTVYRYFPDRDALMKALWHRTTRVSGPRGGMPRNAEEVLARLEDVFAAYSQNAQAMIVATSTLEGRAVRNAVKAEREVGWRKALAKETEKLPDLDRKMALGVIQLLSTGLAWRDLHDQWDLDGSQIATACRWAIATLLRDLEERDGRPLSEAQA